MRSATTEFLPVLLRSGIRVHSHSYEHHDYHERTEAENWIGGVVFVVLVIVFIIGRRSLRK